MANPQKENGYSPIANEILDKVSTLPLNGTQFRIIMVVWRYTYGFSRKEHELAEKFIAKVAKIHEKQVHRELLKLIKFKIVNVVKTPSFNSPRIVGFNKNYDEWEVTKKLPGSEKDGKTGSELVTQDKQDLKTNIKTTTKGKEAEDVTELIHYQKIIDSYNSICTGLPKAIKATENRKTHIRARWVQFGGSIEFFESYFREVSQSAFLNGNNNRRWKADFDWLFNEANMVKVLEGKYNKKTGGNGPDLADKQMEQLVKMGEKV